MGQVAYKEAQANLEHLIQKASQGEEIIIECEDGRRFRLTEVLEEKPRPTFGSAKGEVRMLEGVDDPIEGFEEFM